MKKYVIRLMIGIWIAGLAIPVSAAPTRVREAFTVQADRAFVTENYDGGMSLLAALPEKFDLREEQVVSAIRDQGSTNSCWAFSALACTENFLRKKSMAETGTGKEYDFSERHMEHATYPQMADGINPYAIPSRSVDGGGNVISVAGYFQNGLGPVDEADMPFSQEIHKLTRGEIQKKPVARVRGMRYFPRINTAIFDYNFYELIAGIKEEIYHNGGVAALINTAGGTYNADKTAYHSVEVTETANHSVTLVGWDDTYSRENFGADKPSGDGAWLVRNSDGADQHDGGYFYLSYETLDTYNLCASVTDAEDCVTYDHVYGTTSGTWCYGTGYENNDDVAYAANVYQKQAAEELLTEVSFDVRGYTEYEIYVVPDGRTLSAEHAVLAAKGTENHMGFVTVTLPEAVPLTGTEFAVIVKYKTPGYSCGVPVRTQPYCPEIMTGVSFLSADGEEWKDTANTGEAVGIFGYTVCSGAVSEVSFLTEKTTYVSLFDEDGNALRMRPDGTALLPAGTYTYVAQNPVSGIAEGSFSADGVSPCQVQITEYVKLPESNEPYLKAESVSYRANLLPMAYVSVPLYMGRAESYTVTLDGKAVEAVPSGETFRIGSGYLIPLIQQGKSMAECRVTFYEEDGSVIGTESVTVFFTKSSFAGVYHAIQNMIVNPTETVTKEYAVNLIAANLAIGGEIFVQQFTVEYPTERQNGYMECNILVLDAVSGKYFRIQHSGAVLRVTQEVTKEGEYYRVNVRNNVDGIKTVNVFAEYDETGRLVAVTTKNVALVNSSFAYRDRGYRVKIFTLLRSDMITPCVNAYESE